MPELTRIELQTDLNKTASELRTEIRDVRNEVRLLESRIDNMKVNMIMGIIFMSVVMFLMFASMISVFTACLYKTKERYLTTEEAKQIITYALKTKQEGRTE